MFRFIVMNCGYVESCMTAPLIYGCRFFGLKGFSTRREAITELALDLHAKYHDERLDAYNNSYSRRFGFEACCRAALAENHDANFCSKCGNAIKDKEFGAEDFMEFVRSLHESDCDSYGEAEWANDRHFSWWPWSNDFIGASKDEFVVIPENAEQVLLMALYDVKPELRALDPDRSEGDWEKFKNEEQPSYQ